MTDALHVIAGVLDSRSRGPDAAGFDAQRVLNALGPAGFNVVTPDEIAEALADARRNALEEAAQMLDHAARCRYQPTAGALLKQAARLRKLKDQP
jgi:hypothetical protein